ncbi:MAG TPA: GGDEF domain-containing protein [Terriglobales bacterium]|nr:GGDEF domain-containing protein [Terriglobales bacterium]
MTTEAAGASDLRRRIQGLEARDVQLWGIALLLLLVVAAGVVGIILPNLAWNLGMLRADGRYLPQLLFGFIALVILANVYVMQQHLRVRKAREELIDQVLRNEALQWASLTDALTETFSRHYLTHVLPRELSRLERSGDPLTLLMMDVDEFKRVNTRLGHQAGDRLLAEVAHVLRRTLRNSDTIIRYGGDEFLALLWETGLRESERVVERVHAAVRAWNETHGHDGYRMSLSCGLAEYLRGRPVEVTVEAADQQMYRHKAQRVS